MDEKKAFRNIFIKFIIFQRPEKQLYLFFFFQNNVLPSGEKSLEGLSIVIQDVTRHHSGIYTCTANNNVGQPDTAEIDLKVLCK